MGLIVPTRAELTAERCRRSLRRFTLEAWPLVEPGTVFVPNWHLDAIADALEAVSRREIRRLIINIPPRHMKSLETAVFWPCWEWIDRPETKWLFASYAQTLSTRDSLKCRRLLKTEGVRSAAEQMNVLQRIGYRGLVEILHGEESWTLADDQDAKQRFENTRMGYRLATSVGGTATGEGGDIIVIDDPHKANEAESDTVRKSVIDWFDGTMRTRLNQPKTGAFVLIMQRVHEEDLVGHLISEGGWEHICLPAEFEPKHPFVWPGDPRTVEGELLWPARVGDAELVDLKKMGAYNSAGQLQQRPAPAEGLLFKRKHFRRWRTTEHQVGAITAVTYLLEADDDQTEHIDAGQCRVFQAVDVAASDKQTADWTVVSTWALTPTRKLLLLDVARQQFDVLDVSGFLKRTNQAHGGCPIWVETFGAGRGPARALQVAQFPVMPLKPEQGTQLDKIARAWPAVAAFEAHEILLPVEAEWLGEFEAELLSFPNGRNDDQVDTVSYAARLRPFVGVGGAPEPPDPNATVIKPLSAGMRTRQF